MKYVDEVNVNTYNGSHLAFCAICDNAGSITQLLESVGKKVDIILLGTIKMTAVANVFFRLIT
jgi:hypothetical protein